MKKHPIYLLILLVLALGSCSKDATMAPAEAEIAQKIAGNYTLTKLTNADGANVLATGSAAVKATSNTMATINLKLKVGATSQEISSDYKISQSGSQFIIKDSNGTKEIGNVSGKIMTMNVTVFGIRPIDYTAEFIQ